MLRLTFCTYAGNDSASQIPVFVFDGSPNFLGPDMPVQGPRCIVLSAVSMIFCPVDTSSLFPRICDVLAVDSDEDVDDGQEIHAKG
jgi:hypothetical protein